MATPPSRSFPLLCLRWLQPERGKRIPGYSRLLIEVGQLNAAQWLLSFRKDPEWMGYERHLTPAYHAGAAASKAVQERSPSDRAERRSIHLYSSSVETSRLRS